MRVSLIGTFPSGIIPYLIDRAFWTRQNHFTIYCLSSHLPHSLNYDVNLLVNVASRIIPSQNLLHDTFSVELLYKPSIPDNMTNWIFFYDDQ
jgi:hypothetical protein